MKLPCSEAEWAVLRYLYQNPAPASAYKIAKQTGVARGKISQAVAELLEKEHLTQLPDMPTVMPKRGFPNFVKYLAQLIISPAAN